MVKNRNLYSFIENVILVGLIGNLILPNFKVNDFGIGIITISSLILWAIVPLTIVITNFRNNRFLWIYLIILFGMYTSIKYSFFILGVEKSNGDYMELFRYIQILPYIYLASFMDYNSFERKLYYFSVFSIIFIVVLSFLEITNFSNSASIIGQFYSSPTHIESMLSNSKRIIISGSDPNVGALIAVFFLIICMMYKGPGILSKTWIKMILFLLLIFTQSRTVIIGSLMTLGIYLLVISKYGIMKKMAIVFLAAGFIFSIIALIDISYITDGIKLAEVGENSSLNVRFENYIKAINRFSESPIFGWGPSKAIHSTIIDSEYALIIQRYGLLGIFTYLIWFSYIFYRIVKTKENNSVNLFDLRNLSFLTMVIGLIVMTTNNFFSGYQSVSIPIIIIVGLISLNYSQFKNRL